MQRLSHKVFGNGAPLLLIHGMGSASTAWKLIQDELALSFTVITVDLPGHGDPIPWISSNGSPLPKTL
ncbi:MAG: alpha/beta fold hydrolase [Actinomycetota bacterium]